MIDKPAPPHTYKQQRAYEKDAGRNRTRLLAAGGMEIPPMCGYTYLPRASSKTKSDPHYVNAPVNCARTAGSSTPHLGTGFCDYHEWATTYDQKTTNPVQYAAALRIVHEKAKFFGRATSKDPHTMLLEEIGRTASIVEWLEDKLKTLSEEGVPDDVILQQYSKVAGFKPSVWMELLQNERKHLVSTCVAAIKAGVAERKVQIAETQGRMIAAMMMAFMHDPELGLTPVQMIAAPKLIRKHLLALPTASETDLDPQRVMQNATQPEYSNSRNAAIDI